MFTKNKLGPFLDHALKMRTITKFICKELWNRAAGTSLPLGEDSDDTQGMIRKTVSRKIAVSFKRYLNGLCYNLDQRLDP